MNVAQAESQVQGAISYEVRCLRPGDSDALVAMYRSFRPKGAALRLPPRKLPQRWLEELGAYGNLVAVAEGRVVGHAVLCAIRDNAEVAVLVHQDFRGRGLGKKLLGEAINEARRLGLRRVWGIAEVDDLPMRHLAYSLGWTPGKQPGEFFLDLHEPVAERRASAQSAQAG